MDDGISIVRFSFYESVKMTLWFNCHTSSQNTSAAICILTIGCLNNGYTYLGELEYEKPNGEFTAKIAASGGEIACPFAGAWTADYV